MVLLALGFDVTLVTAERLPEGGAPRTLAHAGVRLELGPRETVASRLSRLSSGDGVLVVTSIPLQRAHREAIAAWPGPLVLDLDHLASTQRRLGRVAFRDHEQPGIDTEIADLDTIEAALIEQAALVIANSEHLAAAVRMAVPTSSPLVVPPSVAETGTETEPSGAPRLVLPGRFGDEFATPDETVVAGLPHLARLAGLGPDDVVLVPEDTVPLLRHTVHHRWRAVPLEDAAATAAGATMALDLRPHGAPTTARRTELSAAGVAWVASSAALGFTDAAGRPDRVAARAAFGELAELIVADSPEDQARVIRTLVTEPELRTELCKAQRVHTLTADDQTIQGLLSDGLASAGAVAGQQRRQLGREPICERTSEYLRVCTLGTLAAADPRIEALEAEMVPLRTRTRDDSINLQSTLEADARYRAFARTHLDAPPAGTPRQTPASQAVRFSILVPTYNSDPELLDECIASVTAQQHGNWQLCIVDDGSTTTQHHAVLGRWAAADARIAVQLNAWNQGIALTTNDALALAGAAGSTDHWIVLLDHDDLLKPDALAWVARYASECPDHDLWYSDEDKILLDGSLGMPFFKPDWSPELEMGVNYVCHLLSVRAELMHQVGGFRRGFDGAQDYDLVLRLVEAIEARGGRIGHIAKPLYSWRMIPGSTALNTDQKPEAHLAGHRALQASLDRRFEPATVEDGEYDTTHRIRFAVDTSQLLTVLIPTRDRVDLLRRCIDRLRITARGLNYEILVVDNDSTDPDTLAYLDDLLDEGHQVVRYPHEFSFARQVNLGALHARGDLLLILNNDTWARNDDWLLRMMEHAQRPEVGLVGARLLFPEGMRDGRPQHEGIVMGMAGLAYNVDLGGYMGMNQFVRNTSGVTAACVMLRPSAFFAVGGMEERLRVAYNDVDFGLRVGEFGYRIVYTPRAELIHPESASRGDLHPSEDELWLVDRWGPKGSVREPFVSPHFEWMMPVFYRL
jgi:glycosyltransferase involved in cell wall biosynthesis